MDSDSAVLRRMRANAQTALWLTKSLRSSIDHAMNQPCYPFTTLRATKFFDDVFVFALDTELVAIIHANNRDLLRIIWFRVHLRDMVGINANGCAINATGEINERGHRRAPLS